MLVRCVNAFCLLTCFRSERRSRSAVTIGICKIMTHFLSPSRHGLRKRQPYVFICCVCCRCDEKRGQSNHFIINCFICNFTIYLFFVGKLLLVRIVALFCRAVCVLITSGTPSLAGGVIFAIFIHRWLFLLPFVFTIASKGITWGTLSNRLGKSAEVDDFIQSAY